MIERLKTNVDKGSCDNNVKAQKENLKMISLGVTVL